jgi:CheY-like chemotaxis protein
MTETNKHGYQVFLSQILSWAKECLTLIQFKKAWEKGKVPKAELAAKALDTEEADQKLVDEIFHADLSPHTPSLDIQKESTQQLAEELSKTPVAWPEPKIQVFGETSGKSKKKERAAAPEPASEPAVAVAGAPTGDLTLSPTLEDKVPFEVGNVTPAPVEPREETAASFPNRPTILVIDDYKPLRRMIQKALNGACYNVCTAEDGVEGIVRIHENAVDLVVCDVQMPRLDGFEMSKMLNVRDSTRDIPIIFLTEVLDEQTKAIARRLGAADTLIKPFTMDSLFESIRAVLASHPGRNQETPSDEMEPDLVAAEG